MEGYHDWKTTFETKVAYINDKKFLVDDGKGERIVSKNNLLSRFAHQKKFVKWWLLDPDHRTSPDFTSPKLTKDYIEKAIIKYMDLFKPNEHILKREEFNFCEDGHEWYIRKDFYPKHEPATEKDVEYYISAANYRYSTGKRTDKSFFRFIYIDRPGYLNETSPHYRTIKGTVYRI